MSFATMYTKQLDSDFIVRTVLELSNGNILFAGSRGNNGWYAVMSPDLQTTVVYKQWTQNTGTTVTYKRINYAFKLTNGNVMLIGDSTLYEILSADGLNRITSNATSSAYNFTFGIATSANVFLFNSKGNIFRRSADGLTAIDQQSWTHGTSAISSAELLNNGNFYITGQVGRYSIHNYNSGVTVYSATTPNINRGFQLIDGNILILQDSGLNEVRSIDGATLVRSNESVPYAVRVAVGLLDDSFLVLGDTNFEIRSSDFSTVISSGLKGFDNTEYGIPIAQISEGTFAVGGKTGNLTIITLNQTPTLTLTSPADNLTLTEGNTYQITGNVTDADDGDVVTVKYKINNESPRNITASVSDGSTPIPFNKTLTYVNNRLYDGKQQLHPSWMTKRLTHSLYGPRMTKVGKVRMISDILLCFTTSLHKSVDRMRTWAVL